jgi:predicted DNA-binding transcriptional regulator AlpA
MMNRELLSKREVCEILRISIGSLDRMMKKKEINYIKFERSVRFEVNEIDRLLNELKVIR